MANSVQEYGWRRGIRCTLGSMLIACLTLVGMPHSARAIDIPLKKGCKSPSLAAGLEWVNPDPLYLQLKTNVRWQNCRGLLTKVVVETRWMDYSGGLLDTETFDFLPDTTQFKSGSEFKSLETYLDAFGYPRFTSSKGEDNLQSCSKLVDGRNTTALNGDSFYAVITGYNKTGKKILGPLVTPAVPCGTNG